LQGAATLSQSDSRRQQVEREILELIISEGKVDRSRITPDATLESLEVQSMDTVMILMAIEEKFGVYVPVDSQIAEAKDLAGFVRSVSDHILKNHD
jgi:acyl carrier protein